MSEKKLLPKLRFSGFDDEWKEVKLGEISTFLDNKRVPLKEDDRKHMKGEYPYYGASGIIDYVNDYIFDEELILMGEDGANIVTRSSRLIFLAKGKYWVNNHAHVIKANKDINQYFLSESLEKINYEKYNTGTAQPKLNREVCQKIKVNIPKFDEQNKIANFLSNLDKKIGLLEQKHLKYQNFKKYLMQQIFAQKLRFKNFEDKWVQVKLKDIVERVKRKNTDLNSNLVLTISAEHGLINQEEFFNKIVASKSLKDYYLIKNGEFAYNKSYSNGYPYGAIKRLDNYSQGVLSSLYICFKPTKINSDFLKEYFETNFWHKEIYSIAVEGARNHGLLNININDFFNTKHYIPPSYEEQEEIAKFFKMFNWKINSINNELKLAKNFKKGLLQQMFI